MSASDYGIFPILELAPPPYVITSPFLLENSQMYSNIPPRAKGRGIAQDHTVFTILGEF